MSGKVGIVVGSIALLGGIALAHGVAAQTVHQCRDGAGHIAYQDHACARAARDTRIAIAVAPPVAPPPEYRVASAHAPARGARPQRRAADAVSYECRAEDGEVFYRHRGCPRTLSVDAAAPRGRSARAKESIGVSAVPLTRSEGCRRLAAAGSIGRAGHAHDDRVSTYERNAGRDPCRQS